jgi:hypothetical protein
MTTSSAALVPDLENPSSLEFGSLPADSGRFIVGCLCGALDALVLALPGVVGAVAPLVLPLLLVVDSAPRTRRSLC